MEHRRVIGLVKRTETGRESAEALIAVHLQVENVDNQGVARFGAFDEKGAGERIVALGEGQSIAGLFNGITEAIE